LAEKTTNKRIKFLILLLTNKSKLYIPSVRFEPWSTNPRFTEEPPMRQLKLLAPWSLPSGSGVQQGKEVDDNFDECLQNISSMVALLRFSTAMYLLSFI